VVMLIFLVGLALSLLGWGVDRYNRRSDRRASQARLGRLVERGYRPRTLALAPALPGDPDRGAALSGWSRGDARLLDDIDAKRLRDLVAERWDALAAGETDGPVGDAILLAVDLGPWTDNVRGSAALRVTVLRPDAKERERTEEIPANDDGLFDVTDLLA
jgi:hypothetical protein